MPHIIMDDGDSDDEIGASSSVLLAVPDGLITDHSDLQDPTVSRAGGRPAFLTGLHPNLDSSFCKNCSNLMELLVQIWCPPENNPLDRVLYVWGCARAGCQRQQGSIRAFRGISYNAEYAKELKAKNKENKKPQTEVDQSTPNSPPQSFNPFAMATLNLELTGIDQVFVETSTSVKDTIIKIAPNTEKSSKVVQSSNLRKSDWDKAPQYQAYYLATVDESDVGSGHVMPDKSIKTANDLGEANWSQETYENTSTDPIFDRFADRVSKESEQCLRYEMGGTPMSFQTDDIFEKLFPPKDSEATTANAGATGSRQRAYDPGWLKKCGSCGMTRVFECQLMPHLHSVLRESGEGGSAQDEAQREEDRKKEVTRILGGVKSGVGVDEHIGMGWGTCLVYSCGGDCCDETMSDERRPSWREEEILVQWDE